MHGLLTFPPKPASADTCTNTCACADPEGKGSTFDERGAAPSEVESHGAHLGGVPDRVTGQGDGLSGGRAVVPREKAETWIRMQART